MLTDIADESVKQRDALINEIQQQRRAADDERDRMTAAHETELQQLETELTQRSEDTLHRRELSSF